MKPSSDKSIQIEKSDSAETEVPSRRELLKFMSAGAVAVGLPLSTEAAGPAPKRSSKSIDVVVIGGGYSGVTAARDLQLRGMNVVLLEARNRLGGRTFSTKFGNEHAELGGTAVHWNQPHVWAEVMRYGLELVDNTPYQDGMDALLMADGKVHKSDPMTFGEKLDKLNRLYFADAPKLVERPYEHHLSAEAAKVDSMSAADRLAQLQLDPVDRSTLNSILNTYFLGSSNVGAYTELLLDWTQCGRDTALMGEITTKWAFKDGTISLINAMVKDGGFEVRLSSAVTQVKQSKRGVEITTEDGKTISSRYAVVTVPINTLSNIDFQPALNASKQAMARERHACYGQKIYVKVKGNFNHTITGQTGQPIATVWPVAWHGTESTTLVAYTNGPVKGFNPHDAKSVQAFLAQFVPDVEVMQTLSYDWGLDPYSLGAHSLFKKGQYTRYLDGLREREGRLFFAGDLLAYGWRAYIDGAIESGMRTAQDVVATAQKEVSARNV